MDTHNQYDENLAEKYEGIVNLGNPAQLLAYESWLAAIGQLEGVWDADVLDIGCGTGVSTRLLAEQSPRRIVGLDYSEEMLQQAYRRQDLGCQIEYGYADCSEALDKALHGGFDFVTAMWLFHYADSREMLLGFAQSAYSALRPGGFLVAVVQDKPEQPKSLPFLGRTGQWIDEPNKNGSRQRISFLDAQGNEVASIVVHVWGEGTYRECFGKAGFKNIHFTPMCFPRRSRQEIPQWREVEQHMSCCSIMTACK